MLHTISQIFNGAKEIDERRKYQALSLMIGSVHVMFMLFFFSYGLLIPAWYNVFVVLFYFSMIFVIEKRTRFNSIFLSAFLEIIVHSVMVTLCIGWDGGFMSYTVALIPLAFYVVYTIPYLRNKLYVPILVSLIVAVAYFSVMGASSLNPPIDIGRLTEYQLSRLYLFNTILTFLFMITISVMFSVEIRIMQYHLESENVSLSRLANYDALTKLLNRRSMNVQLKQVLDEVESGDKQESFCLIMTDIDDFKKVNDTYGHSVGDEVLIEVASILQSNVREEDRVCRWGGEEMLILLRSDMEVARSVAQRICTDMATTALNIEDNMINITLTLGVSEYKGGETIRSLIETADQRMYRGKRSGKNCVVWN